MSKSDIQLANESVEIMKACQLIGMSAMDYQYNGKMYCPFGDVSHADGGDTKSFRVYAESNSAYCFACAERYSPVKLVAVAKDITEEEAAEYLLEFFEVSRESVDDKWARLTAPPAVTLNTSDLAESLKIYCARINPDWETLQFREDVAETFRGCLALLSRIRTLEDIELWRTATRKIMRERMED